MTLKQRIVAHLAANTGVNFTNQELAAALNAPTPSVRRATLQMMSVFTGNQTIVDAGGSGSARSPYRYTAPASSQQPVEATQL